MKNKAGKLAVKAGKEVVASTVSSLIGLAVFKEAIGVVETGKVVYHYNTDTMMVKKHFWSKPVEVYVKNGKPVIKK